MESQTIIYHKPTGRILQVLQNRYIRHRADLSALQPTYPNKELAFFYEHQPITIDTAQDHIKQIVAGAPPLVLATDGRCKSFESFSHHRRQQISAAQNILCNFEGGMGDQILQAEAVHQFKEIFPKKFLTIAVHDRYFEVVRHIQGIKNAFPRGAHPQKGKFDFTVDMHTPYISDPRGGFYGKASLYGASLGLKSVHTAATIHLSKIEKLLVYKKLDQRILDTNTLKIGIHIRSGSGHGKSWNTEPAEALALRFINEQSALVCLFGHPQDWQIKNPSAIVLGSQWSWFETTVILSLLSLAVCIDSGPMHIARALGVPHLILWGGTSYKDILGRDRQPQDVRAEIDCIDKICYDCPKGVPLCMKKLTPEIIYPAALALLHSQKREDLNAAPSP